MTPLRRRFLHEMTLRNSSPRTIEAYLAALVKLSKHFQRPLDQLDSEPLLYCAQKLRGCGAIRGGRLAG